ncbi:unnamed protein product, partial [Sphacelaria rigidula]
FQGAGLTALAWSSAFAGRSKSKKDEGAASPTVTILFSQQKKQHHAMVMGDMAKPAVGITASETSLAAVTAASIPQQCRRMEHNAAGSISAATPAAVASGVAYNGNRGWLTSHVEARRLTANVHDNSGSGSDGDDAARAAMNLATLNKAPAAAALAALEDEKRCAGSSTSGISRGQSGDEDT